MSFAHRDGKSAAPALVDMHQVLVVVSPEFTTPLVCCALLVASTPPSPLLHTRSHQIETPHVLRIIMERDAAMRVAEVLGAAGAELGLEAALIGR
jgi:hypothetical protein